MTDVLIRRIDREHGDGDWIFFKMGEWAFPIMILNHYEAVKIAFKILGIEEGDPASLTNALRQRDDAQVSVNLLIEQMSAIGDSQKDLPEFLPCPNCRHTHEFPVTHCAECKWPPIPK